MDGRFVEEDGSGRVENVGKLLEPRAKLFADHERTDVASYRPYFLGPMVTATRSGTR